MFKKFFAIIFCCFMVATTATAATIAPRQECILTNKGMVYRDNENAPHLRADYVILFNNNESKIPTTGESGTPAGKQNCTDEVKNLINELATKKNDIETVLLFGSADSIGKSEANAKLAQERVNTVNKLLNDAGITTCELDDKGNIKKGVNRCATMTMGDAFSLSNDNLEESWEGARAVFMFVIHKNDTCNTDTISTLSQLTDIAKKANNNDILSQLTSASELCNNEKKMQILSNGIIFWCFSKTIHW